MAPLFQFMAKWARSIFAWSWRRIRSSRPLQWSLLLHGALLLFVFSDWILAKLRADPPPEHVFELVVPAEDNPDTPPAAQATPAQPVREPLPPIEAPEVAPPPPRPTPPTPAPQPQPQPAPKPTPQPKPKPKPEPAPAKQMSYAEFIKQFDAPKTQPAPRPRPKPVEVPQIQAPSVREALESALADAAALDQYQRMSSATQSSLQTYFQSLSQRINLAFQQPGGISSLDRHAVVTFTVTATGSITDVRLSQSSGNGAFDAAAMRAVSSAATPGAPPGGQALGLNQRFYLK